MNNHGHAERGGHRIDRDVVVGRPDPAGGKQIVVGRAQLFTASAMRAMSSGTTRTSEGGSPARSARSPPARYSCPASAPTGSRRRSPTARRSIAHRLSPLSEDPALLPPDATFASSGSHPAYIKRHDLIIAVAAEDRLEAKSGIIKLYGPEGFEGMRTAGRLAAEILDALAPLVVPGVSTQELDASSSR